MAGVEASGTLGRFVRFLVIGVVNTGVGYGLYALFVLAGLAPQPSLAAAFTLGVLWNYFAHARYVFGTRGFGRLPMYAACYVGLYILNSALLELALRSGLGPLLAQGLLAPVSAVLSFFLISKVLTGRFPILEPPGDG